ncbi:MAG TPA: serine protease [bacterium]|nr:serine protease [bacterium]HNT66913.1 serine protease [bacterium]HOX86736.1 serine protease [bacterium]HPG46075.1 serine protease [bacterium]HPM98298.1 serine protease [bacterium]
MSKYAAFCWLAVLAWCGCTRFSSIHPADQTVYSRYESDFAAAGGGQAFTSAMDALLRIYCSADYTIYQFSQRQTLQRHQLSENTLKRAISTTWLTRSVYSTGTLVDMHGSGVLIVTCNHITDFADTLISYRRDQTGRQTLYVETVSIKVRQTLTAPSLTDEVELEVLGCDREKDILLLVGRFKISPTKEVAVFPFQFGPAGNLEWGTKTALLGFPRGVKSVTRGMVCNPVVQRDGKFVIDALFNMGYSGGPVLATRREGDGFEWIGMALSSAGESLSVLVPEESFGLSDSEDYPGIARTHRLDRIFYGLCNVVSAEEIARVFRQHRDLLRRNGFDLAADQR